MTTIPRRETARTMPTMAAIVRYWSARDPSWLKSYYIGWGEPFCFACGWLPPVDSWDRAGKWLDRAHLKDRFYGGSDKSPNLVPLCHLCHDEMPDSDSWATGMSWVKNHAPVDQVFQVYTDCRRWRGKPIRVTTMLRARVACLELILAHTREAVSQ